MKGVKPLSEPIPSGRSAAFERDRVVRLVAGDGYHVHRLIYEALAKDGVRDFLFAPFAATGKSVEVFDSMVVRIETESRSASSSDAVCLVHPMIETRSCISRERNSLRRVCSTSCCIFSSVKIFPRVARINFFMSSRRTPKPRPATHATTSNPGWPAIRRSWLSEPRC